MSNKPFTLTMPKLSPTMEEGAITKWLKKVGDFALGGDALFEVATDKASVEYHALDQGFLRKILVQEGQSAQVGQPVAIFTESKEEDITSYVPESLVPPPQEEVPEEVIVPETAVREPEAKAFLRQPTFAPEAPLENYEFPFPQGAKSPATPYAKKLAKEKGIDLASVKGSGPRERIESRDLSLGQADAPFGFGRRECPQEPPGSYEEVALSPMRKVIAERLQQSKSFIPHFYLMQEVRAEALMGLKAQLQAGGLKVTFNDMVVKAVAMTLRQHPVINSGFHGGEQKIIRFQTIDISIAVSISDGLITPIVRYADYKNLGQLSVEIKHLVQKAREGKLAREEYVGGSFTISNLGMFGVTAFAGIINPPQAAILSVGGVVEKPVVEQGAVIPGQVVTLSLSADHRVIDGADAAEFMRSLKELLENPALLLL